MESTRTLIVEGLARSFGGLEAVKGIGFSVNSGEVLGFLGPNGAGKTTTMQMITGNLAPGAGRIEIAGYDLLDSPREAKAAIGYLPEQPPVYRELTVDEFLDYCASINRIPRPKRRAARDAAKEKCGLTDVGQRLIGNLSKGYQQRVGIAQAIIHLPPLIVLDEPTAGLDPNQIREIRELVRNLGREHSVILSTHILPEVQGVCSRVQIIHQGNLVLSDSIEGLTARMKSSLLIMKCRKNPATERIERLAGVKSVEVATDGSLRIFHDPGVDPSDELMRLAVQQDWGVSALVPQGANLEDIFVHLTTNDTSVVGGAR